VARTFLDGIGFRDSGLRLARPVAAKSASGRSVTVTQFVSTAESSVVVYEVEWNGEQDLHPQADRVVLHGASTDPACRPGGMSVAVRPGKLVVDRTLPPLVEGVARAELEIHGGAGEWRIPLDLESFGDRDSARQIDASDTRHGITIAVRGIVRRPDATILDIALPIERTRMVHIGGLRGLRDESTGMVLRDGQGREHSERVRKDARDRFPHQPGQDVGIFDALPADAGHVVLEIPYVSVTDHTASVEVALPVSEPSTVELGGAVLQVRGTRAGEVSGPGYSGKVLVVEVASEWRDDKRVAAINGALLDGVDRGLMHDGIYAPAPEVSRELRIANEDPAAARLLTFRWPDFQLRGPWRLELGELGEPAP
jgi:hypothetical protein